MTKAEEIWQKLNDYVIEWMSVQVEDFSERYPYTWTEVFNDAEKSMTKALLEEPEFINLMHEYVNEIKTEV